MWLAIDTATDRASVALGASSADALEENLAGARRHASQLLPMVESLLRRAGATLDDLSGLALSDGPGSFTGLRVGAAVAKAFVRTRHLPLWVAPSLLVRAAGVAADREGDVVVAVANALRGDLYAAAYRFGASAIVTELAPTVLRPDVLVRGGLRPAAIVGDAPADLVAVLERWSGRAMVLPPDGAPRARHLIGLVGRTGGAARVDEVGAWEPTYGRPAEAQARWEMAHGGPLPNPAGDLG